MIAIDIKRGNDVLVSIKPDQSSNQSKTIMGDNIITMQFDLNLYIGFQIGDWCTVYGENYYINQLQPVKKESARRYQYTLVMQSEYYDLSKVQFMFYDANNELKEGVFSLMGNPDVFMDLLIKNANRVGAGWTKGAVINGPYMNMTFNSENCMAVLGRMAAQFGTEYFVQGKKVHLDKRQIDTGITLRQGKDRGLYEIDRQVLNDSNVITRLYAFGADKNLAPDYRNYSTRLLMSDGQLYIEKNVAEYGVVEHTQVFDNIYPHRTGKITSVNAGDPFLFVDTNMDFDLNAYLLPGVSAKVTFNTGQLSGYTFDINSYNSASKTFRVNKNKDEKALDVPSDLLRPAIGDEYVLVDIRMPETYVKKAEADLKTAAMDLLNTNSEPQQQLAVTVDPAYFRKKNIRIDIGDLIWVYDLQLAIDNRIRVTAFTRDFDDEYKYQLTLSDSVSTTPVQDWYGGIGNNSRDIADLNQRLNNRSSENNFVGEVIMADIPATSDTTGMLLLYVDANGKVYKKI
ncbi:hypothetical protein F0L74_17465 [Chitinophaga agrisoli]|uniref:Prophage tail endopeptidase domain-containing protein n=1 Tax=Chitinophaga agrisoli TaxID=2607653 RepID=A0A5B2VTU0_9BACT|nr:phage tail protein [Chitinophaga agrisoli]KAA2241666.1 hypothetical protein F0L74_17465 [Chitinophaga agrisoli]